MDNLGNLIAREGYDRCSCGCKYWENDLCVDCGRPAYALYSPMRDCDSEFGFHEQQGHRECGMLLALMNPEPFYDDAPYTPYTFYETGI